MSIIKLSKETMYAILTYVGVFMVLGYALYSKLVS
jgi:hypothetical protein